ncbi:hypothetical protein CHH27_13295 [Labrenzia sp. VG12]|nr:hypothetical protein CHH27_13295 [Labrenzia sp. VG12]
MIRLRDAETAGRSSLGAVGKRPPTPCSDRLLLKNGSAGGYPDLQQPGLKPGVAVRLTNSERTLSPGLLFRLKEKA